MAIDPKIIHGSPMGDTTQDHLAKMRQATILALARDIYRDGINQSGKSFTEEQLRSGAKDSLIAARIFVETCEEGV